MMNSIKEINEAIDNHDQRGIELDWPQQKALLYNFRALIKSKDRGLDERAAEVTAEVARLRTLLQEWNDLAQHQGLSTQAHRNRTADTLATPPAAAAMAAGVHPKAAALPAIIPVVESLEEAPLSGPAILEIGCRYKAGQKLFVPMLDRKALWIACYVTKAITWLVGANEDLSDRSGEYHVFSTPTLHLFMAHQMLNVYLLGEAPKTWIWAATRDEAEAEAGRVLGGMGLSGPLGRR